MDYELDERDIEMYQLDLEGRKYLEYYEKFKSRPCFYGVSMPNFIPLYGDLIGLYDECIRQNKIWEELLGWNWEEYDREDIII